MLKNIMHYFKAMKGNPDSQYAFALTLINSEDQATKDRALYWLDLAAQQNHHNSCLFLANHYIHLNQLETSTNYLRLASTSHNPIVDAMLGQILIGFYTNYINKIKAPDPQDLSHLDKYVQDLYQNALSGDPISTTIDEDTAIKYLKEAEIHLKKAIEHKNPLAQHTWAIYNLDYVQDLSETQCDYFVGLLQSAVDQGFSPSMQVLAGIYENGLYGVKEDVQKGLALRIKAAKTGSKNAQFTLGMLVYKGNGFIQDREKGLDLILSAANNGHVEAQDFLKTLS